MKGLVSKLMVAEILDGEGGFVYSYGGVHAAFEDRSDEQMNTIVNNDGLSIFFPMSDEELSSLKLSEWEVVE